MKHYWKHIAASLAVAFSVVGVVSANADTKSSAEIEEFASEKLEAMTLEQKVGQMLQPDTRNITPAEVQEYQIGSILSGGGAQPESGNSAEDWANRFDEYQEAAVEGFGIPLLYGVDAVHGHNGVSDATMFPHNIGLGQANDEALMQKIAEVTATEMRATGTNWTFTPTLGLPKNERWGRTYETYGENAELSAKLGAAYINGSQGSFAEDDAIATAKHFIGEGIAKDGVNQGDIPFDYEDEEFQKILKEELLVPYKEAIENDVKSIMITYNSFNGTKAHGKKELITDLLKDELGFEGIVITDYNGVDQIEGDLTYKEKVVQSVNAGMDMFMVDEFEGDIPKWQAAYEAILDGVNDGKIAEERIDDAVTRILSVKYEMGLFDNDFENAYANRDLLDDFASDEHKAVARDAVAKSLTLLKNSELGNSTLMSELSNMENIVVAGSSANDIGMQNGGWTITWQGSKGNITEGTTIYDGMKEVAPDKNFALTSNGAIEEDKFDAAVLVMGEEPYAEYAGDRKPDELVLSNSDIALINKIKENDPDLPIVAVLTVGRPITIANQIDSLDAVIMAGLPGSEGAGVADVLFGDKDFNGNLTLTWPWYAGDIEEKFTDPSKVMFEYGRGLKKDEITPLETTDPRLIDLSENNGIIEAEDYATKHPEVVVENKKNIAHFWENRYVTYNVQIPKSARYTFSLNTAVNFDNTVPIDIYIDGVLYYSSSKELANTGGWNKFELLEMDDKVSLPEGKHELKIVSQGRDFNIDYFQFVEFDDDFTPPDNKPISDGTGPIIQEGAVGVTMSSSELSQDMSWYKQEHEISNKNAKKEDLALRSVDDSDITNIVVNDEKEYQTVLGLGTSIEESTVNNMVKMSPEKREEFIRNLIDPVDGMGNTLLRVTIGTSDFTGQDFYTYYDGTGEELNGNPDWYNETGNGFSIQNDIDYGIIEVINQIQEIAKELGVDKELRFFASSWTPPGWMKTETAASKSYKNNELLLKGGRLNDDHIADLAKYYVRYLEEYEKHGITMYAMTMQNEPLLEIDYPSAYITGSQEAVLAKHIKEELAKSEILSNEGKDVKVWAFDHNFDGADAYIKDLFETADGRDNVDGIAFHPYGGSPETMGDLYNQYKGEYSMHLTERSVWGTDGANDIITWFRNGSESYNGWVTMLDSNVAPHQWVGTPDPTMFVQDAKNRDNYWATPEVYMIGQFSKYIRPGYVRIDSTNGSKNTVTNVAFKDPATGRIILVATNRSGKDQPFKVTLGQTQFNAVLPAGNTATYMWDPIDLSNVKEITDDLTLEDPVLSGSGKILDNGSDKVEDKTLEEIDDTTTLTYMVNVKVPGSYKVEFDVAAGKNGEKALPIQVSQEDEVLGTAHVKDFNSDNRGLNDYQTVQTYVEFEKPGIQSFDVAFPEGGMNFKDIQFTKEEAVTNLPGILDTTNYFDKNGLVIEGEGNFGFSDRDEYVDYKVNVQKTDEYNVIFDVATDTDNAGLWIDAIDEDGSGQFVGEINFENTNGTDQYEQQTGTLNLTEGEYTLRFKFKSEDTNLRQIIVGSGIKIDHPELIEGELNGQELTVTLVEGKFAETLDKEKWNLDIPTGVDFKLERVDDQQVKLTLLGEVNEDFDNDLYLILSVDADQCGALPGTSLTDGIIITAVDDLETLKVAQTIDNNAETVAIEIEGGTFTDEVAEALSLSGDITDYISIEEVERIDFNNIEVKIKREKPLYGDMKATFNLKTAGYKAGNTSLQVDTTFKGSSELPTPISIGDEKVSLSEDMAYRNRGSLETRAEKGNYIDFYLGVQEAGEYTVSYDMKNNGGINNGLKFSGGAGLATDNLGSVSFPNIYNNNFNHRSKFNFMSGDQTLRFEMNAGGFEISNISIEKVKPLTVGDSAVLTAKEVVGGSSESSWVITPNLPAIEFTVAGTYVDYNVDVKKAGTYEFQVNAATSESGAKAVLQSVSNNNASDLGTVAVPNGGSWDKYQDSEVVPVELEAGVQTLRVYFKDRGFNLKSASLNLVDSSVVEVDKTELEEAVKAAKERVEADYTPESWSVFADALAEAEEVLANDSATQEDVQEALQILRLAEVDLEEVEEPAEIDKTELAEAIESAKERVEADYTPESWSIFTDALAAAEEVLADDSATQEDVREALKVLRLAEIDLEKVEDSEEVDKSELERAVKSAKERVAEDYTAESWSEFADALAVAEEVLADDSAIQEEVQAALKNLVIAEIDLEKIEEPEEINKAELAKAVKSAKQRDEADYTPESWSKFAKALATAEEVLTDDSATQEEVQAALKDLIIAETSLEKISEEEPEEVDKTKLAAAVESAKDKKQADYTAESWKPFVAALKEAERVLVNEDATQEDVQKALDDLRDAENNLAEKDASEEDDESGSGDGDTDGNLPPSDNNDKDDDVNESESGSDVEDEEDSLPQTGQQNPLFFVLAGFVFLILSITVFRKKLAKE